MKKYLTYGLLAAVLILAVALVVSIFRNTSFNFSNTNGQLSAETEFPNATCRKVIQFKFPPVRLECENSE